MFKRVVHSTSDMASERFTLQNGYPACSLTRPQVPPASQACNLHPSVLPTPLKAASALLGVSFWSTSRHRGVTGMT